jgi:hypothetical protein
MASLPDRRRALPWARLIGGIAGATRVCGTAPDRVAPIAQSRELPLD